MSNYTKATNFTSKDSLTSGNALKVVKGSEIDAEFDLIETAVNSKSNTASPTFTGTVTVANLTVTGTTTVTTIDGGTLLMLTIKMDTPGVTLGRSVVDFLTDRNNLSGLASIGLSNAAINRLQGLGDTAKTETQNLYNKVAETGKFNPFTVTAGPGSVSFDKFGGATYTTDPSLANFQTDLTNNAQAAYNAIFNPTVDPVTGELTVDQRANRQNFINAITGKTDIAGNLLNTGGLNEREQMVKDFVGSDVSLTDPFTSAGIASREQDIFNRLQALREPGNEEARVT